MKALVAYYSRTGTTRKAAKGVSKFLKCDAEEILDTKDRSGPVGYLLAGKDATLKRLTKLKQTEKSPLAYDLVVIGTPVWAFTVSAPVRTYIHENKGRLKKVAFFCTMEGTGGSGAFREMEKLCGKKPVGLLELKAKEVWNERHIENLKKFCREIMDSQH